MTSPTKPIAEQLAGLRHMVATARDLLEDSVPTADAVGIRCEEADMVEVWALRARVKDAIRDLHAIKGLPERKREK